MSITRERGQFMPDATPLERATAWSASIGPYDCMSWVGKDYSLAEAKADVASALSEVQRENAQLREDADDDDRVRQRMSDLLTQTANALKGPPKPLTLHDWSDLPAKAELAVELAKQSMDRLGQREEYAELSLAKFKAIHLACAYPGERGGPKDALAYILDICENMMALLDPPPSPAGSASAVLSQGPSEPGIYAPEELWLIHYADTAMQDEIFTGPNAEAAARERFSKARLSWTAWLFRAVAATVPADVNAPVGAWFPPSSAQRRPEVHGQGGAFNPATDCRAGVKCRNFKCLRTGRCHRDSVLDPNTVSKEG